MPRQGGGKQQVTLFENVSKVGLLDWPRLPKKVLFSDMDMSYSASGKLKLLLGINTDRTQMHVVPGVVLLPANEQRQTKHVLHDLYSFR